MAESSLPFEVKGGSPLVLQVTLNGQKYELRVVPIVFDVMHAPDRKNEQNPEMPVFVLSANVQVDTKKVVG